MRSLIHSPILLTLILPLFLLLTNCAVFTVDSTSPNVGVDCNYTITLTNQTSISSLTFSFTNWTTSITDPFYLSRTQLVYTSTTLSPVGVPGILKFTPTTAWIGSNFSFVLTNMRNPSSTKPYLITLTVDNGTSTNILTANLTRTSISTYSLSAINYTLSAGATSNNAELYLTPLYGLLQNGSYMSLTYNSNIISLSPSGSSTYTVVSNTTGRVVLGNFATPSSNILQVVGLTITNPQAVTSHAIVCLFYLNESGTIYNIENFTRTITLTPAPYSSISAASGLYYGSRTSLTVTSSTPYTAKSNGTTTAYTILTYSSSEISFMNTTNCVAVTSTTCKLTTANNITISDILGSIGNFTSTTLTFTLYTYYNLTNSFVPLCQSNLVLNYSLQSISASSNTTLCTNSVVGGQNNITLTFTVNSVTAGDTVYISGFKGIPSTSTWTAITISSKQWYYYTIKAANLVTVNSTTSTVLIYLPYSNNNYTLTTSNITSLNIYRSSVLYASSSSTPSLCPVTTPSTILTSSLTTTTLMTYAINKISLDMSFQFYDYAAGDYLLINFKSSGNGASFLLGGSYVGVNYSVSVNGIVANVTAVNDTGLKVVLSASMLPTSVNTLLKIVFSNITNPPMQQTLSLQLTTYEATTSGLKETLNSTTFTTQPTTLTSSTSKLQLLANNTLNLILNNHNRNLTTKNITVSSSVVTVSLPSVLNCSLVTNSTSIIWNTVVQTSTSTATGNTTYLSINLGICYVSYFTGSISYTVTQQYANTPSTSTSISTSNICKDGCYQCTSSACTKCFNSTNSNLTLLYSGTCYSTCPTGAYKSDVGVCANCHQSCATCSGGSYLNCTTCATSFQLSASSSYCASVCGSNKYLAGSCASCHINCQACLSDRVCYVCKTNATLIGSVCEFTTCFSPCLSCMGNQANCTACISGYSFYQSSCMSSCPTGTYQSTNGGESTCLPISEPVLYVPLTIVGAILMIILFGLRAYASKKIGNYSRRSRLYKNDDPENINYKLNCWRMGSIVYTFLEIIGALLIALKNSSYSLSTSSTMIAGLGLILHLLANITFLVGFCVIVLKKKVQNDNEVQKQVSEQQKNLAIRYKIVMVISGIFSFRTYKILYANLFVDKNTSTDLRITEKAAYPNEQTFNHLGNTQITSKRESILTKKIDVKQSKIIIPDKFKKNQKKAKNGSIKQSPKSPRSPRSPNSKKPIVYNAQEEIKEQPALKLTQAEQPLSQYAQIYFNKKFNHPFLTYLTLVNLLTATLIIIIGSIIQIMGYSFVNMLWWGVDCLIVSIVSFGLTSWDLWNFANLKREEQHSEMSSNKNEVNQTYQNLKQAAEIQIQVDIKNQKKFSPKKLSSLVKPSFSNRSTQKGKENDQNQQLPVLKVFDDFDEKDQTVLKEAKTKKFSTKNLRYGNKALYKRQASIANTKRNIHGELCDDIYINFQSQKIEKQATTTTYMKSRGSVSPRSLKQEPNKAPNQISKSLQKEEQKQIEFDQQDLEQQPPNFANISDIEQVKVQGHNVTISSGLIQEQIQ